MAYPIEVVPFSYSDQSEPEYPEDVAEIIASARKFGLEITPKQAEHFWMCWSNNNFCSWEGVDGRSDLDQIVGENIAKFLAVVNENSHLFR